MLWTIAVVLFILWLLGLISGYTLVNFIHILLVIAIIVLIVGFIQGEDRDSGFLPSLVPLAFTGKRAGHL